MSRTFNDQVNNGGTFQNIKVYGSLYDYICEEIKATSIENIDRNEYIYHGENEFPYIGSRKEAIDTKL